MKKNKKKKEVTVTERLIRVGDAEKCPLCGLPFELKHEFKGDSLKQIFFKCFSCNKVFFQQGNEFKEINEDFGVDDILKGR